MREIVHIQGGQCGNQIGAKFWEVSTEPFGCFWERVGVQEVLIFHFMGKPSVRVFLIQRLDIFSYFLHFPRSLLSGYGRRARC